MDTEKCRALFEILKYGSFSAAAQQMGYTPSGLSRMMASLEDDAGFPLLQRSRDGVKPTNECLKLLPVYKEFVTLDEKYKQMTAEINGIETGTVVVGTAYSIYYKWLSNVIKDFKNAYPNIEVKIVDGKSSELYQMMSDFELDFAIVSKRDGRVSWHHLFDDPLVAVVSKDDIAVEQGRFPISRLKTEPYIDTFPGQDTDNARMFIRNDLAPNTQFETEDTYASYRMVEAGLGVSLSNYIESKERSSGENVCLIELDPPQIVEIGIITHIDEVISPVARKFRGFVMGYIEDIIK